MKTITLSVENPKKLKSRKHHQTQNWSKVYYYYKKHKTNIKKSNIVNQLDHVGHYQKDTFYKIESMSNKDQIFDYYRILKKKDSIQYLEIDKTKPKKEITNFVVNNSNLTRTLTEKDLFIKF